MRNDDAAHWHAGTCLLVTLSERCTLRNCPAQISLMRLHALSNFAAWQPAAATMSFEETEILFCRAAMYTQAAAKLLSRKLMCSASCGDTVSLTRRSNFAAMFLAGVVRDLMPMVSQTACMTDAETDEAPVCTNKLRHGAAAVSER
jgi:hypothetical protein